MEHRQNGIPNGFKNGNNHKKNEKKKLTSTVAHQTLTPTSQNKKKPHETTSETTSLSTNPTTTDSNNPGGQFILSKSTIIAIVLGICLFLVFFAILIKIVSKWRKKKTKISQKTDNNNSNDDDVNHDDDRNCDELWENHHYEEIKITGQNLRSKSASFSVIATDTEESQDNTGEYNRISEIIVFETKPDSSEAETILIKDSSGYSHVIRKQSNPKIGQQIERTNNNSFECSQMIVKCLDDKNAEQEMNAGSNSFDAPNIYCCIEEELCAYNVLEDMTANNEKQNLYNEVENIQSNEEQVIKRENNMYKVLENASSSDQHDDKGTQNLYNVLVNDK